MGYRGPGTKTWETETKVGVMTRSMTQDVKDSVKRKIEELYADENGELNEEYRKGCAEWHWNIVAYFNDHDKIISFTAILELLYNKKIDPRTNKKWRRVMRQNFPFQFIKKVNDIGTQVPVLAVMDDSKRKQKEIDPWD